MFPTSAFNQATTGYQFPGQQQPTPLYQSQFGGVGGFNPQAVPSFQQALPPRGQSLPSGRQYPPPPTGPYQPGPPSSSRRQQHGQYSQQPPPASSHHYEHRSSHGSKHKKHHKRRSVSPNGGADQDLYSDHEQQRKGSDGHQENNAQKQSYVRSRSPSPTLASRSKQDEVTDNSQQQPQQSQVAEGINGDATKGGVARSEEEQAVGDNEKRKSSSTKKKHHRRDRYENYNTQPQQGAGPDPHNLFQQPYPSQQYPQQPPAYYGEYQNELPPQLKVHRQPLYSGYNQAYEESVRRGDVYRKQAKRSTRLPPEVKQQLLPHEDDQENLASPPQQQQQQQQQQQPQQHQHHHQQQQQQQQQQPFPFGPAPVYSQQSPPVSQQLQPFSGIRPPFNPYQPYGGQQGYFGPAPGPAPYNASQPWSNAGAGGGPAEQEIQRLRSHIHTLEGELHKLQRKLTKATLNDTSAQGGRSQDEGTRSHREHRRSKRDGVVSPRQTPVIVELNSTTGEAVRETSSKKHRHRTGSNVSSQQTQNLAQQDSASIQRSGGVIAESKTAQETESTTGAVTGQSSNQQSSDARERSRSGGNQISETEDRQGKPPPTKNPREETAAQLAHAAAAHVNNRQGANGNAPQQQTPAPPPPSVSQVPRPQLPNQQQQQQQPQPQPQQQQQQQQPPPQQQQQQQQFLYQQGALPPQGQQIRGPPPRLPAGGNFRFPNDPYQQQQQQQQQQYNHPNPNYNQSNNNELSDDDNDDANDDENRKEEEQNRSAEKILDAFEYYYMKHDKTTTTVPMKVKYIPEENNSNNRYRPTSRRSRSNSSLLSSASESIYSNSPAFSRHSLYDNNHRKSPFQPARSYDDPSSSN